MMRNIPKSQEELESAVKALFFFRSEYRKRTAWFECGGKFGSKLDAYQRIRSLISKLDVALPSGEKERGFYLDDSMRKILDGTLYIHTGVRYTAYPRLKEYAIDIVNRMLEADPEVEKDLECLFELSSSCGMFAPDIFNLYKLDGLVKLFIKNNGNLELCQDCYEFCKINKDKRQVSYIKWFDQDSIGKVCCVLPGKEDLFKRKIVFVIDYLDNNFDLEGSINLIRAKIVERRTHQKKIASVLEPSLQDGIVMQKDISEYLSNLDDIVHFHYDTKKKLQRLIGLMMWDRIHIEGMAIAKAFEDVIKNGIICGYSPLCQDGLCDDCPENKIVNSSCYKNIVGYYHGTYNCIKSGDVLNLVAKEGLYRSPEN